MCVTPVILVQLDIEFIYSSCFAGKIRRKDHTFHYFFKKKIFYNYKYKVVFLHPPNRITLEAFTINS